MSSSKSLPRHTETVSDANTASAPFNFVPLPEAVVTVDELPPHDRFEPGRCTGFFKVDLETCSPLYIRAALTLEQFKRGQDDEAEPKKPFRQRVKNKSAFFYTQNAQKPVIPGSSLRGMLRTLLEIISYGKVNRVTDKRLFYRSVGTSTLGKEYGRRMVKVHKNMQRGTDPKADGYEPRVRSGFVRKNGPEYKIEVCDVARVKESDLCSCFGLSNPKQLYNGNGPNAKPKWTYQHTSVWVDVSAPPDFHFFQEKYRKDKHGNLKRRHPDLYVYYREATNPTRTQVDAAQREGTLVLTGPMQHKKLAFVFIPQTNAEVKNIPNDPREDDINKRLIDLFHDDDQLSPWQKDAFPKGKPSGADRKHKGFLRDKEPVFFLEEEGEITFLGRAQLFRLPYQHTPLDLVPEHLRQAQEIDFAEALFGYVRTREERKAINEQLRQVKEAQDQPPDHKYPFEYAGRVRITDATWKQTSGQQDVFLPTVVPKILASPKPTCFQHYLVQEQANQLSHYDSGHTTIRGHKLYWHQGNRMQGNDISEDVKPEPDSPNMQNGEPKEDSSQHTQLRPVRPGVVFSFRVYFENLSAAELGALCWTLQPQGFADRTYQHKLGMAKPFGLGSVALKPILYIQRRAERYRALFNEEEWRTTDRVEQDWSPYLKAFRDQMLAALQETAEPGIEDAKELHDLHRIQALLKLMEWDGQPADWNGNRYLKQQGRPNTRYMSIKHPQYRNEYRKRPVLPDPLAFAGNASLARQPQKAKLQEATSQQPAQQEALPEEEQFGEVTRFNNERKFGFIRPDADSFQVPKGDVFVHISEVEGANELLPGDRVRYYIDKGSKGYYAFDVLLDS